MFSNRDEWFCTDKNSERDRIEAEDRLGEVFELMANFTDDYEDLIPQELHDEAERLCSFLGREYSQFDVEETLNRR